MNAGKINLGLLLIIFGAAAFAVNLDAMHWTVYFRLLELWPVIPIVIGLQMVLRRLFSPLAYTSCLLLAVVGFWVLYNNYAAYGIGGDGRLVSLPLSKLDENMRHLFVDIDVDEGDISIAGSSTELMRCYYEEPLGKPVVKFEADQDVARVFMHHRGLSGVTLFGEYRIAPDWSIKLYEGIPTTIELKCIGSELNLRLTDLTVEKVVSDARHSKVNARFGALVPDVSASMRIGRSEVKIGLPDGAGVEILNADRFDEFYVGDVELVGDGDILRTPGFDSSAVKFRFDIEGKPRSLRIAHY